MVRQTARAWLVVVLSAVFAWANEEQKESLEYRWDPWQSVARPDVPELPRGDWARNPIDAFLADTREKHGLTQSPAALRHVLLRRVYLDLVGLPPTVQELRAFLSDASPDDYETVVDRLLEAPEYGERWGRHWMDVWRYSDWAGWGDQVRDSMPHIWRWRDWIIESLAGDKPYDRMILEMLAADELAPDDTDALRATGFLVRNYKRLSREQWMQDTVNHTTKAFLGLTLDCARCHDHMYDAVSQDEYYQFRAIFEPYNVRTDRIPGEANVDKDGLVRVYDAEPGALTYFLVRGDERQADKDRPMQPGVPAALGGAPFVPREVMLPDFAQAPDRRPFVADDDLEAAAAASAAAKREYDDSQRKLEAAEQAVALPGPETSTESSAKAVRAARHDVERLEIAWLWAEATRMALAATIRVERLEEQGGKQNDPAAWEQAAQDAGAAQQREAVLEKRSARFAAREASRQADSARAKADRKLAARPDDTTLKMEAEKAAEQAVEAREKLAAADAEFKGAQEAAAAPPTTEYKRRHVQEYPRISTGRRLALARWIADPWNPRTARVAVNHIWMRHFGQPLVESVFEFGNNGQLPSHPALLDWLAAEFVQPSLALVETADGLVWRAAPDLATPWSMKHLHRLIVTSTAYRMASSPVAGNLRIDPDNQFLWRMPARRMESEVVRDCVLRVGGQLDLTRGGPDIDYREGLQTKRRSLYFRHAPEKQMTFLSLFDAASPAECYRRKESIMPQQALALANSALALEQSRHLARQLHPQSSDATDFVSFAFQHVLSRPATADEISTCLDFLGGQQIWFEQNRQRLAETASLMSDLSKPAPDAALRARENLVHVLLNHHDFVTIH